MQQRFEVNELIVDDADVMKLDSPFKVAFLFDLIASATLTLNEDFPDEKHFIYVRVGDGTRPE